MQISKRLQNYLLKLFDLHENELQKTLLLQLNIFLLITTLLIVKPTINSLFLSELSSEALPIGYILTAAFAIIGSYFYDKTLEKYALNKIIERTLIGCVLSLVLFAVLLNFGLSLGYFMYVLYIWVAIYGLLTTSQFWILTNLVYNIREAKRVFGFIGSGAIAGGIFGGYLTSLLSQFIDSENLFFIGAGFLFFCIPISRFIWKNEVKTEVDNLTKNQYSAFKGEHPIKLIKKSKLLSLIAIVIGLGVIVAKLVDYQYSHYASELINDADELTAFFGFWFSSLSIISLLIQLFITKRIVGRFGVGNSMFILPVGILIASILLIIFPELWVVIIIKIADGSLKQSVNKASTELLSIPIPIELKKKTKTFIDVVIDSIATGFAGCILIFIIHGLEISNVYVTIITIGIILVWIYFIIKLKKQYITAFKKLLYNQFKHKTHNTKKTEAPITSIIESVNWVLKHGTETQIKHMLYRLIERPDERFFYNLKNLLHHDSPSIKALAIESLYFLKTEDLTTQIEELVKDSNQDVAIDAFRYVLDRNKTNAYTIIEKYFNNSNEQTKNAVLIGMSLELNNEQLLHEKYKLHKWVNDSLQKIDLESSPKEDKIKTILIVIGNCQLLEFKYIAEHFLFSNNPNLVNAAIDTISQLKDENVIENLIELLSNKQHRINVISGLFKFGPKIIPLLTSKIISEKIELKNAVFIPQVIEKFNSQIAVKALISIIDETEHAISVEALESLKRLKWNNPKLEIKNKFVLSKILNECHMYQLTLSSMHSQLLLNTKNDNNKNINLIEARQGLMTILEHRLDRQLHRIFMFLGLKFNPEEIDPVADIILKGKEDQRTNAIEFLDNILEHQLKRELIPIAESAFYDDQITDELIKKFNLKNYNEYECYNALLNLHDIKIKHAVLYLIKQTNNTEFVPLLENVLNDSHESIRLQTLETLNYLNRLN